MQRQASLALVWPSVLSLLSAAFQGTVSPSLRHNTSCLMIVVGQIKTGAYFDSVTLMRVGKELAAQPGVADAAMVMGTKSNKAILQSSGLLIPRLNGANDTDLLIAVSAKTRAAAEAALAAADGLLSQATRKPATSGEPHPASLDGALQVLPGANLALISVAGRYAGGLARQALERGLHVMLFSDNVPLEQEIALKQFACKKGLLVMGPDCGTAIINGAPLGFANAVNRGGIGIVAAAGTGLQEVSCLISNAGEGVSQAIGTGGRDVKPEVGGLMFIAALKALAHDKETCVILLVSKPPHPKVLARIEKVAKAIHKPLVRCFIGAQTGGSNSSPATLEAAALQAVALARGRKPEKALQHLAEREVELRRLAQAQAAKRKPGREYLRGLFSGGTFCAEAQVILRKTLTGLYSNAPIGGVKRLRNSLVSQQHTVIDLGEDEFTVGRPHPMIDYSLRNRRILQEAADPETAVILLDVVLGCGAESGPRRRIGGRAAARNPARSGRLLHHRHRPGPAEPPPGGSLPAQTRRHCHAFQRRRLRPGGTDYWSLGQRSSMKPLCNSPHCSRAANSLLAQEPREAFGVRSACCRFRMSRPIESGGKLTALQTLRDLDYDFIVL